MSAPSTRRVVLLYGLWNIPPILWPISRSLKRNGWEPEIWSYPSSGKVPLDELARRLSKHIDTISGKPHIVAYSMGGLVSRYFIQKLGGAERVSSFTTLATPHRGTVRAQLLNWAAFIQMRIGSEFLRDLNSDLTPLTRIPFQCLWTPNDLTVYPATNSYLEEFPRVKIPVILHNLITCSPTALQAVNKALCDAEVSLAKH